MKGGRFYSFVYRITNLSAVSPFNVIKRINTDTSLDSAILALLQSEQIDIFPS
jgi:hypothetical protein